MASCQDRCHQTSLFKVIIKSHSESVEYSECQQCPVDSIIGPWSDNCARYGFQPVDQDWLLPWCSCHHCDSGHVRSVLSLLYITWFTVTTADDYMSAWIDCLAPSDNPKASQVSIRFISSCTMTQVGWCLQQ